MFSLCGLFRKPEDTEAARPAVGRVICVFCADLTGDRTGPARWVAPVTPAGPDTSPSFTLAAARDTVMSARPETVWWVVGGGLENNQYLTKLGFRLIADLEWRIKRFYHLLDRVTFSELGLVEFRKFDCIIILNYLCHQTSERRSQSNLLSFI